MLKIRVYQKCLFKSNSNQLKTLISTIIVGVSPSSPKFVQLYNQPALNSKHLLQFHINRCAHKLISHFSRFKVRYSKAIEIEEYNELTHLIVGIEIDLQKLDFPKN